MFIPLFSAKKVSRLYLAFREGRAVQEGPLPFRMICNRLS